jgi:hypothetical protein
VESRSSGRPQQWQYYNNNDMPIICCRPRSEVSESGEKSAEEVQIDACFLHNKAIEFICTEPGCEA